VLLTMSARQWTTPLGLPKSRSRRLQRRDRRGFSPRSHLSIPRLRDLQSDYALRKELTFARLCGWYETPVLLSSGKMLKIHFLLVSGFASLSTIPMRRLLRRCAPAGKMAWSSRMVGGAAMSVVGILPAIRRRDAFDRSPALRLVSGMKWAGAFLVIPSRLRAGSERQRRIWPWNGISRSQRRSVLGPEPDASLSMTDLARTTSLGEERSNLRSRDS